MLEHFFVYLLGPNISAVVGVLVMITVLFLAIYIFVERMVGF